MQSDSTGATSLINISHPQYFGFFEVYHILRFSINIIANVDAPAPALTVRINMWIMLLCDLLTRLSDYVPARQTQTMLESIEIVQQYIKEKVETPITKGLMRKEDYSVLIARDALLNIAKSVLNNPILKNNYGNIQKTIKKLPDKYSDYVAGIAPECRPMSNACFLYLKCMPPIVAASPMAADIALFAAIESFALAFRMSCNFFDLASKSCSFYTLIFEDPTRYAMAQLAYNTVAANPSIFITQLNLPNEPEWLGFEVNIGAMALLDRSVFDTVDAFIDIYYPPANLDDVPDLASFVGVQNCEFIKQHLKKSIKSKAVGVNYLFYGEPGLGKTAFALALCKELGIKAHLMDYTRYNTRDVSLLQPSMHFLIGVARGLAKAPGDNWVCISPNSTDFFRTANYSGRQQGYKNEITEALSVNEVPFIYIVDDIEQLEPDLVRSFSIVKEFKAPSRPQVQQTIKYYEDKYKTKISKAVTSLLVENRVAPCAIEALCSANSVAKMTQSNQLVFMRDYISAMGGEFDERPVVPTGKYNYSLLNTDQDLQKITNTVLASGNKNFQMLLHGVSGTGKSEFAKVMANTLGIKVIKKKASDLMSKWAGETEQRIRDMFEEQREEGALLLIDEAEYFLHDRRKSTAQWENSIVGEMLANMEDSELPIVMTTNVMGAVDPAFMRRFTFTVKFDYMRPEQVVTAFKHFLKINLDNTTGLNRLAPGDFTMFKKRNAFLGLKDPADIIAEFKKIQEQKNERQTTKIGFSN